MFSMEETKRVLTTRLRDLAIAAGHDITTHPLLEEGRVGKAIHKLALQRETDLVVVGTHGGGTLQRLMLGSRAEEIFREVPCPVLTVGPCVYRRPALEIRFKHILYATDFSANSAHAAPLRALAGRGISREPHTPAYYAQRHDQPKRSIPP